MINDFDKSSINMVEWSCAGCGCVQWMPVDLNTQLRASHKTFYCPSGHGNVYNDKSDNEELENKLMNEYSKNAQLEKKIEDLEKENKQLKDRSFISKWFNI